MHRNAGKRCYIVNNGEGKEKRFYVSELGVVSWSGFVAALNPSQKRRLEKFTPVDGAAGAHVAEAKGR